MHLSNALRQRIIELMQFNKLKKFSDLAKISNVKYTTLISFMNGNNKTIYLSTLYLLCEGLNVSLYCFFNSYLFDDIVDENEKNLKVKN